MAKIGGFDPGSGIVPLNDGHSEIGRANLPASTRLIPESVVDSTTALIHGKLTNSSLLEHFGAYLSPELHHRELLSPEVFFETLGNAAESFLRQAEKEGEKEGPLVEAARKLAEILADRTLCEMLKSLILKA